MRHRLKDVAERAGVSVKTVSNVVNGYQHVRPDTRARVERAIAELNYRPNLSARNLRKGRTGVIALAGPELDVPSFAELARHVVAAAERGWTVLVDRAGGGPAPGRAATGIGDHLVDGLIVGPLTPTAGHLAGRDDGTPVVLLGGPGGPGPADHVATDDAAAARAATAHLISLGRRRVAAIGARPTPEVAAARLRLAGYAAALAAAGIAHDERLVVPAPAWRRADGAAAVRHLLTSGVRPDAVLCLTDTLALGALRALHEAGLRVPGDVAVAGFDDIEDGRFSVPTLTTVAPDRERVARLAVALLADRIDGDRSAPPRTLTVPYRLEPRESTLGR